MNYETIVKNIELSKTVTISHVNEVIDELLAAYDDDQPESWECVYKLLQLLETAEKYNGSSDHYHNLAVSLARADQYDYACDILKIGLQFYGYSMDLLADFLAYAAQCNRISEGQSYFEKLMKTEKKYWNWRAFNFSIDYLLARITIESNEEQQKGDNACIDELLKQFQEYHKNDEKAYFAEYTVAAFRNEEETAIVKLEEFINNNDINATRCTMKVAEYYFNCGQYDLAEKYIKRCKTYITTSDPSVEPGYIYMLSALCGMCQIYTIGIDKLVQQSKIEDYVKPIYKDCEAANAIYHRNKFSRYKSLEMQREVLEKLSGIPYEP